jgi:hypothetical protein
MKALLSLLMLAAVLLSPLVVSAEEQLPVSIRSAVPVNAPPARPWRLADGPRMSVGAAELKLDVAAKRWGITMSLAL